MKKQQDRSLPIGTDMLGQIIQVYNGHKYTALKISERMLGYKLGFFVPTRTKTPIKKTKKIQRRK